jgi:hypothetical protein
MNGISITLLTVRIAIVGSIIIAEPALASITPSPPYELIYVIDGMTEEAGSITLTCRDGFAEQLSVAEVLFFLNRSSPFDPSIRERGDVRVVVNGCCRVRFNLTRSIEGFYTCGKRVNFTHLRESPPVTLLCKWVLN